MCPNAFHAFNNLMSSILLLWQYKYDTKQSNTKRKNKQDSLFLPFPVTADVFQEKAFYCRTMATAFSND